MYYSATRDGTINLQATLSSSSSTNSLEAVIPHHPVTCPGELALDVDGTFRCPHATASPDNHRTQHCIDHSIALLLIEIAVTTL